MLIGRESPILGRAFRRGSCVFVDVLLWWCGRLELLIITPIYTSLFTITVAKIRKVNKMQQCEAKQLN